MKIVKANYITSAVFADQFPPNMLPEIVFVGRSNVGKSSLINMLTERKKLAYFSQRPGKTQTINFYNINNRLTLVDVPGYGYAKVSAKQRSQFAYMMETYFSSRVQCAAVCLLLDIRHQPTAADRQMLAFLEHHKLPLLILLTKADKCSKNQQAAHVRALKDSLHLSEESIPIILTSASTHLGKDRVWAELLKKIALWEKGKMK